MSKRQLLVSLELFFSLFFYLLSLIFLVSATSLLLSSKRLHKLLKAYVSYRDLYFLQIYFFFFFHSFGTTRQSVKVVLSSL